MCVYAPTQWCYNHATGKVVMGTVESFYDQLKEPKAW